MVRPCQFISSFKFWLKLIGKLEKEYVTGEVIEVLNEPKINK